MFEIAGMPMNKVSEAFPERRFKIIRVNASMILNIMQGFSKYRAGDVVNVPDVQFPPGTQVLNIRPDFLGGSEAWLFLLHNEAWDSVEQNASIPSFEYNMNPVWLFKAR